MPFSVIKEVKRVSKKQRKLEKTRKKLIEVEIEMSSQEINTGKGFYRYSTGFLAEGGQGGGRCP